MKSRSIYLREASTVE